MPDFPSPAQPAAIVSADLTAHAILIADRLTVDRTGRGDGVMPTPYCYQRDGGYVVIFRYGVAVMVGLSERDERSALAEILAGGEPPSPLEEERLALAI